jgi:hypothetical protein
MKSWILIYVYTDLSMEGPFVEGARDSVVGWGTMLQSRDVASSFPGEVIGFFNWPNPSSRNMALLSTQPLTEMSTRKSSWGESQPARKVDNLTAIC